MGRVGGFAKAAELNGYPGPVHLFEIKHKIHLTDKQIHELSVLLQGMKMKAVPLGKQLVQNEKKLNELFQSREAKENSLITSLEKISKVRKKFRYVHLATHLKAVEVLTKKQITDYNYFRDYSSQQNFDHSKKKHP